MELVKKYGSFQTSGYIIIRSWKVGENCFCHWSSGGKQFIFYIEEVHLWILDFLSFQYGRILRENYKSFKSRHVDAGNPGTPEYNSQQVPLVNISFQTLPIRFTPQNYL